MFRAFTRSSSKSAALFAPRSAGILPAFFFFASAEKTAGEALALFELASSPSQPPCYNEELRLPQFHSL
jgi:hypothetical protein